MDNHGASGSVNSTARDLLVWLRAHLPHSGANLCSSFSERTLREMHSPHMLTGTEEDGANVTLGYGLGWKIGLYHGRRYSHHEGAFRGMSAYATVLPDLESGVVVLANSRDAVKGRLTRAVGQWILDRLLGAPARDWQQEYRRTFLTELRAEDEAELDWSAGRVWHTRPSLPLSGYAGRYRHPAFAHWDVLEERDGLMVRRVRHGDAYQARLDHWHYDTFLSAWNDPLPDYWPARFVTFSLDPAGRAEALTLFGGPGGGRTRFVKET
jgi:hypothetical protein